MIYDQIVNRTKSIEYLGDCQDYEYGQHSIWLSQGIKLRLNCTRPKLHIFRYVKKRFLTQNYSKKC